MTSFRTIIVLYCTLFVQPIFSQENAETDSKPPSCSKSDCRIEISIADTKGNQNWISLNQLAVTFYSRALRELNFDFESIEWSGNSLRSGSLKTNGLKFVVGNSKHDVRAYWDNSSWSPSFKGIAPIICKRLGFLGKSESSITYYNYENSENGLRFSTDLAFLKEDLSLSQTKDVRTMYSYSNGRWYFYNSHEGGHILKSFTCSN